MSTVHEEVAAALFAVVPNSWAIELPPNPTWPGVVFDIDAEPEDQWCMGGGYVAHTVNIVAVARTIEALDTLLPLAGGGVIRSALAGLASYQFEESCGDADYEPDPDLYARFLTVRLRTPLY